MPIPSFVWGRPFLDRLFRNTLQSLHDRVLPSGFCHTSFGELNGIRCYGESHYPRDAAEAARALALAGNADIAQRILLFHFAATPDGQRYLPHAIAPDGTLIHNNIQSDTLAHSALALEAIHNAAPGSEENAHLYALCLKFADWLVTDHFHSEYSLMDSGNYNEQGFHSVREPILDFFSNASCQAMFTSLARLAAAYGTPQEQSRFAEMASLLAQGIEKHLYDDEQGIYRPAVHLNGLCDFPLNWICFYPVRWYAPRLEPYQRICDILWERTCNDWNGLRIPSGETLQNSYRTMGKVLAVFLAFAEHTHDYARRELLLDFVEKHTRMPDDLWPEGWYHHPAPDTEYNRWFFEHFKNVWQPYSTHPESDYTFDSGNCEQSSVFITETILAGKAPGFPVRH